MSANWIEKSTIISKQRLYGMKLVFVGLKLGILLILLEFKFWSFLDLKIWNDFFGLKFEDFLGFS
jgi:hypothetical protein